MPREGEASERFSQFASSRSSLERAGSHASRVMTLRARRATPRARSRPRRRDRTMRAAALCPSRPSAHTAAPRTSGEASSSSRSASRASATSPELPMAISTLRTKRSRPVRLTGGLGEQRAELRVVEPRKFGKRRRAQGVARGELRLAALLARTCSTGRPRGNRRSRRCGCRSAARSSRGIGPLCSMVRYEMQRRASSR